MRRIEHFNVRVAKARGAEWKKKLTAGIQAAKLNPSLLYGARISNSLKQSDVAKSVEVAVSTYAAIERGRRKIKEFTAYRIAKELNEKVNNLFVECADCKDKYVAKLLIQKEKKRNVKRPIAQTRILPKSQGFG
jgi:DNA-binding XRE family transcriptional regulator